MSRTVRIRFGGEVSVERRFMVNTWVWSILLIDWRVCFNQFWLINLSCDGESTLSSFMLNVFSATLELQLPIAPSHPIVGVLIGQGCNNENTTTKNTQQQSYIIFLHVFYDGENESTSARKVQSKGQDGEVQFWPLKPSLAWFWKLTFRD